jgi:hypothetical protein
MPCLTLVREDAQLLISNKEMCCVGLEAIKLIVESIRLDFFIFQMCGVVVHAVAD